MAKKPYSQNEFRKYLLDQSKDYVVGRKLNVCRYDLIIYGMTMKTIITENFNREYCLKELITAAHGLAFKIYLTKDGIKKVLLDSKQDKEFINFLYEEDERRKY